MLSDAKVVAIPPAVSESCEKSSETKQSLMVLLVAIFEIMGACVMQPDMVLLVLLMANDAVHWHFSIMHCVAVSWISGMSALQAAILATCALTVRESPSSDSE